MGYITNRWDISCPIFLSWKNLDGKPDYETKGSVQLRKIVTTIS